MAEHLTRVPRVREAESLNPRPDKSCTALQTVCHRINIYVSSCVALLLCRGDGHHKLVTRLDVLRQCAKRFGFGECYR